MNLFIDCEFNGQNGQLLSMALIPEASPFFFYHELEVFEKLDPWVQVHVIPKMQFDPEHRISIRQFQKVLEKYLAQFDQIHIVADWPEDITYFCQNLITGPGERINTPPLTMEIRRDLDAESKVPHNAFHDAMAIMKKYQMLTKAKKLS